MKQQLQIKPNPDMNPTIQMEPFSDKLWQIRLLEQEQFGYPMRFRTAEAGIHFWNTGEDLGQHVPPFIRDGEVHKVNPAWTDMEQAPFEFKLIPNKQ